MQDLRGLLGDLNGRNLTGFGLRSAQGVRMPIIRAFKKHVYQVVKNDAKITAFLKLVAKFG